MKECPPTGGDTLFASAYEAYDLLSKPMQQMLEGLNATFMPPHHTPERVKERLWPAPRGAPENVGAHLRATHPCVRTNPVTGWKSLYAFGHHLERVEGLGDVENRMMLEFTARLITENHQLQARVRWEQDDLVVWDNRAVYHVSNLFCRLFCLSVGAVGMGTDFRFSALRTITALPASVARSGSADAARSLTWILSLLVVGRRWAYRMNVKEYVNVNTK